jgi:hypothetical protein
MGTLIFCTVVATATLVARLKNGGLGMLLLAASLLPATGLYVDVGVSLTAARLVNIFLMMWLIGAMSRTGIQSPLELLIILFGCYATVTTIVGSWLLPSVSMETNDLRVAYRPYVQSVSQCLNLVPALVALRVIKTHAAAAQALRAFLISSVVLAALAIAQATVMELWGFNLFPIYRDGILGTLQDIGLFDFRGQQIFRVNALAREPKDLAMILAVALTGWLAVARFRRLSARSVAGFFVLSFALVATYSTTGVVIAALGVAVLVVANLLTRRVRVRPIARRTEGYPIRGAVWASVGVCLGLIVLTTPAAGARAIGAAREMWEMRVSDRFGQLEDYDQVVVDCLHANRSWMITGVGAGNLPWFCEPYLPSDPALLTYMTNLTWDAKSGLLRMIASFGIVGVFVSFGAMWSTVAALRRQYRRLNKDHHLAHVDRMLIAMVLYIFITHSLRSVDELFWLFIGCAHGCARASLTNLAQPTRRPEFRAGAADIYGTRIAGAARARA